MPYLSGLPDFLPSFSLIIGSSLLEHSEKVYRENKSGSYVPKGWLGRILFPFYSVGIVFVYPEQFNLAHPEEEDNQPGLILPGPVGDAAGVESKPSLPGYDVYALSSWCPSVSVIYYNGRTLLFQLGQGRTSTSISTLGPVEPRRANQLLHGNKIIDILKEMRSRTGKPAYD